MSSHFSRVVLRQRKPPWICFPGERSCQTWWNNPVADFWLRVHPCWETVRVLHRPERQAKASLIIYSTFIGIEMSDSKSHSLTCLSCANIEMNIWPLVFPTFPLKDVLIYMLDVGLNVNLFLIYFQIFSSCHGDKKTKWHHKRDGHCGPHTEHLPWTQLLHQDGSWDWGLSPHWVWV